MILDYTQPSENNVLLFEYETDCIPHTNWIINDLGSLGFISHINNNNFISIDMVLHIMYNWTA